MFTMRSIDLPFSNVEGLTDELRTQIMKRHDDIVVKLTEDRDGLLSAKAKMEKERKDELKENQKKKDEVDREKIKNVTSLDEMKQLLADRDKKTQDLEQRILDDEKTRLEAEQSQIVSTFVDKFVNEQVVPDSLVRDAITTKISNRLTVRNNNIIEISDSELTGKTGNQVLDEIRLDKGYSNHLIANKASGGGSSGGFSNHGGGVTGKIKTRENFESMEPLEIAQFVRGGGVFVDQN